MTLRVAHMTCWCALLMMWVEPTFGTITIDPWQTLFKGVDFTAARADAAEPRLQKVFALRIDLKDPDVEFFSTPGNGAAEKETTGQTTTTFVTSYGASVGVNANFFSPVSTIPNDPRDLNGLAISQGVVVSPANTQPMVLISRSNTVSFATTAPSQLSAWWTAVAGSDRVVRTGLNRVSLTCTSSFCGPNPRTAVGVSQDQRYFYMLVIDGRQPGWSDGATLVETGDWLLRFGCWEGLNLDGGGSTAMARLTNGAGVLINRPSGGVQRVNGNHIGVFASSKIPPVIVSQPISQTIKEWEPASFKVVATSTSAMTYQWRFNGGNISGATDSTYTIPWAQASQAGLYSVRVANADSAVISSNATLTLLFSPTKILARGNNGSGQLQTSSQATNLLALSAGASHSLALRADGRVLAWGDDFYGQTTVPERASNVVAIASGAAHNLAIDATAKVFAWGANQQNQSSVPEGLGSVKAVAAGATHSLALRRDGSVVAWGDNSSGQTNVPLDLRDVVAIAAGNAHSLALDASGHVIAWGGNFNQSGIYSGQATVPTGLSNVINISAGAWHSLALRSDGTVLAWGDNTAGQTNVPLGLPPIASVSAGKFHNLALARDGRLFCWGDNTSGQNNFPGNATNFICIAAGGSHSLALLKEAPVSPRLIAPSFGPDTFSFLSPTFPRNFYFLQKSPGGEAPWKSISLSRGSGGLVNMVDPAATNVRAFYRVTTQE